MPSDSKGVEVSKWRLPTYRQRKAEKPEKDDQMYTMKWPPFSHVSTTTIKWPPISYVSRNTMKWSIFSIHANPRETKSGRERKMVHSAAFWI